MREENILIVEQYLTALQKKDLSLAKFADDIYFEDSVAGKIKGAANAIAFLEGFLAAINDVKVIQHICDGDYVVTHWEIDSVFGIIPILEKFRIQDGKIAEAISYYDPRPVLGS